LQSAIPLPHDVQWLNPYQDDETRRCMSAFYEKYYNDNASRSLILGINPGRFGAGITGVPFTDPIRLETECGIRNAFPKRQELSSIFVYDVINAFGGCQAFYHRYYISAICPLGFIKQGKNYNYYDDPALMQRVEPFIVDHLRTQIAFGADTDLVYCLGQGKNHQYLVKLNQKHQFFREIIPLPHPRWVMQYRLKRKDEFVYDYLALLRKH
jgi:hypothetical protein